MPYDITDAKEDIRDLYNEVVELEKIIMEEVPSIKARIEKLKKETKTEEPIEVKA